jgi:glycosyltransferase involved in cell wall biosynthesis
VNVLIVAPLPPRRCGIGAYAATQAARLREAGHRVSVLSPADGAGDERVEFLGGLVFLRAARIGAGVDRIVVHFQPALYYRPRRPVSKVLTSVALLWLILRRPQTELLVHEADRPSSRWRPDYLLLGVAFRKARLVFHTDAERRQLERSYRIRVRHYDLVAHTEGVTSRPSISREDARARLGVDRAATLFVCPGFLHPDKGFDRAVEAFSRGRGSEEASQGRRLVIVGSVREPTPENLTYARRLGELCGRTEGVTLIDGYVSDDDFDAWIAAADLVVLPYRRSWSSGVLARARALGTPAVVSAVGGLPEQAGPSDVIVRTDDELADALVGQRAAARP